MKKPVLPVVRELEHLVEDAAAFIASSQNRPIARGLVQYEIERQVQEIDSEATKFLAQDDK